MYFVQLKTLALKVRPWCGACDRILHNALLAYAGVDEAFTCPEVSQAPSEETILGILLWTLVVKDLAPLEKLIAHLNKTKQASPSLVYLTNKVARKVGCTNKIKGGFSGGFRLSSTLVDWLPGWLFNALEVASAFVTPLGYQCHLISVKSLIVRLLGKESQLVPTILARRDSGNPWFLYMAGDSDRAALTLLSLQVEPGQGQQWCWTHASEAKAWHNSSGWDILFLCKLLLKADSDK